MPPMVSKQYEAGVKAQLRGMLITAAAFRIERAFEFLATPGGAQLPTYVQDVVQRHDGVDLAVSGNLSRAWRFSGGIQILDPKIREGLPAVTGKEPPTVPDFQAKVFAEYAPPLLSGFAVNTTINYTSDSYLDTANTKKLDDFITIGLGARYCFDQAGAPITTRVAVNNLFDKRYWLPSTLLKPGAPRTVTLSLGVEF